MKLTELLKIFWDFLRNLWGWYLSRRQQEEQAVQDKVNELAQEQQTALEHLSEKEKCIDQRTQARLANTDPDVVVSDLNDFFRGVQPGQSGGDQGQDGSGAG